MSKRGGGNGSIEAGAGTAVGEGPLTSGQRWSAGRKGGVVLPNSGQWGTPIAVSRDGGQAVFVQDFGNGYQVYTYVTWTLEVAETLARR